MCTYGRFTVVQRALAMFLAQTVEDAELIVFNTAEEPLVMLEEYPRIKIINQSVDDETGLPYTNVGAVRRDALKHATGDYYCCYDDDDVYMPWYLQQGLERIEDRNLAAWKPQKSFFRNHGRLELAKNVLEASCIVRMAQVRHHGFLLHSGKEGLAWYTALRDLRQLDENDVRSIPAYCFNWNDPQTAPHKQSGDIDNPNNFENHKKCSLDHANERKLDPFSVDLNVEYTPFYAWLNRNKDLFPADLYARYVP